MNKSHFKLFLVCHDCSPIGFVSRLVSEHQFVNLQILVACEIFIAVDFHNFNLRANVLISLALHVI